MADGARAKTAARIDQLLRGQKVAVLTTIQADGSLRSRPMLAPPQKFDGQLWLIIERQAAKFAERPAAVSLTFTDVVRERFTSLSGKAELVSDARKAEQLWGPMFKAWFPNGPKDPNLALLKVSVERAEGWDASRGGHGKWSLD